MFPKRSPLSIFSIFQILFLIFLHPRLITNELQRLPTLCRVKWGLFGLRRNEIFISILRCTLVATVIASSALVQREEIEREREVKSQQNNKKRIVQLLFASFEIIIAFLLVIEFLRRRRRLRCCVSPLGLGILPRNKNRSWIHNRCTVNRRGGSDKTFFNSKNFFRNKSMTRFMNSRFWAAFRCFTKPFQFKQLVSTFFASLFYFSIILISLEMISWLERVRERNPKSDEIE